MGMVFWITGLSGAGKTTIGKILYENLKEKHLNTVFLDGDILRQVFGSDLGYTKEERHKCAMRYSKLCAMLEQQEMIVICCTISMFDSVREWNRKNICNYREIYVNASMDTLYARDQKGLYSGICAESENNVAGIQIDAEEPKYPDLVLFNDGKKTPKEQVEIIVQYFSLNNTLGECMV